MIAIGHLVGYGMGTVDLVKVFGTTLGDSQFKQLTIIAAGFFVFAMCLTAWAVQERVLISSRYGPLAANVMLLLMCSTEMEKPSQVP